MEVIVDTPEGIAKQAAAVYQDLVAAKPDAVLGFATGSTPLALYAQLIACYKAGKVSFAHVTTFNLDEYLGLESLGFESSHKQSYRFFMDNHLFNHVDMNPCKVIFPSDIDISEYALRSYDGHIAAVGGIDMQLLGIGCNGHIGFNEPGTPFESLTHVVRLTQNTREANARFFGCIEEVPTHAVTMGIKTIMHARKLLLIALGAAKADALKAALEGPVCVDCPASVLQLHPNVVVFCDEPAASKLTCL